MCLNTFALVCGSMCQEMEAEGPLPGDSSDEEDEDEESEGEIVHKKAPLSWYTMPEGMRALVFSQCFSFYTFHPTTGPYIMCATGRPTPPPCRCLNTRSWTATTTRTGDLLN